MKNLLNIFSKKPLPSLFCIIFGVLITIVVSHVLIRHETKPAHIPPDTEPNEKQDNTISKIVNKLEVQALQLHNLKQALDQPKHAEGLKFDLSTSMAAHTAQLTLISILLGAIIAALISGLPKGFVITIWNHGDLALDLRVLAVLLAATDLWIKYAWGVIVVRWPFSLLHNFIYFLISSAMIGFALSVQNYDAWLAWGATICFTAIWAYMLNVFIVLQERNLRLHRETVLAEDPPYTPKELEVLMESGIQAAVMILVPGIVLLYNALVAYQAIPALLHLHFSSVELGGFVILFVVADLLYEDKLVMPQQRYSSSPSPDRLYEHETIP